LQSAKRTHGGALKFLEAQAVGSADIAAVLRVARLAPADSLLRLPITSVESPQSLAGRRGLPRYKLEDAAYGDEDQREGGRLCPDPGRDKALVNIIVEFSGPTESMTLTVIAPNEGGEADLREKGITRARDFALQFPALGRNRT
jgi:hypothetical protein